MPVLSGAARHLPLRLHGGIRWHPSPPDGGHSRTRGRLSSAPRPEADEAERRRKAAVALPSWAPRAVAAGLTLFMVAIVVTGVSCLSVTQTQCSLSSLIEGRRDLDVPYIGTRPAVVARMLEAARVGPRDFVVDLGTGDGRILVTAARERGARGLGVDIDPALVADARRSARAAGVEGRVDFRVGDLFETPLHEATVVTMFLLPEVNLRLRPRLLAELRPGARIVSHAFDMGEWRPDETSRVGGAWVHRWTVPANVEGAWRFTDEGGRVGALRVDQHFQNFSGELHLPGEPVLLLHGRLDGDLIRLEPATEAAGPAFVGRVRGGRIVPADATLVWRAERIGGHSLPAS